MTNKILYIHVYVKILVNAFCHSASTATLMSSDRSWHKHTHRNNHSTKHQHIISSSLFRATVTLTFSLSSFWTHPLREIVSSCHSRAPPSPRNQGFLLISRFARPLSPACVPVPGQHDWNISFAPEVIGVNEDRRLVSWQDKLYPVRIGTYNCMTCQHNVHSREENQPGLKLNINKHRI